MGSHFDIRGGNLRIIFILNVKKKKRKEQNCTELGFSFLFFKLKQQQREPKLLSGMCCDIAAVLFSLITLRIPNKALTEKVVSEYVFSEGLKVLPHR